MSENPQNPYQSYMVEASAGSGKTYQLSHRFLNLVGAGADPSEILTITFTVKAVGEMRARIIQEATRLLNDPKRAQAFERDLLFFVSQQDKTYPRRQPLSAEDTAWRILGSTQSMLIKTIDALFGDWLRRFTSEAMEPGSQSSLPNISGIIDTADLIELYEQAFWRLFASNKHLDEDLAGLVTELPQEGIRYLESWLTEARRHESYIWLCQELNSPGLREHPNLKKELDPRGLMTEIRQDLLTISESIKLDEALQQAITKNSLGHLLSSRLITAKHTVSGSLLRGQKREALSSEIDRIEETLSNYFDIQRLNKLNTLTRSLARIHSAWIKTRDRIKYARGQLEFHDLSKGAYRIFHNPESCGAQWLIQRGIKHLLFDEFQDTSHLQWNIFRTLAQEILSGDGLHDQTSPATVFIVGDRKQSIYGFREASTEVMNHAAELLDHFGQNRIGLHHSYRSSPVILNFVNKLFDQLGPIPEHQTATLPNGQLASPRLGRVTVHQTFRECQETQRESYTVEADYVAQTIKNALSSEDYPVYDKDSSSIRPLRPSDILILYRNTTHAHAFAEALRQQKIPYRREEKRGFFERPEVRDLNALVQLAANPEDSLAWLTVLTSRLIRLPDNTILAKLLNRQRDQSISSLEWLEEGVEESSIATLTKLLSKSKGQSLVYFLWNALDQLQAYSRLTSHARPDTRKLITQNIDQFVELAFQLEAEGYTRLRAAAQRLQTLRQLDQHAPATLAKDSVTLMTIHKAKGLEAPMVFVVESASRWYRCDRYWVKSTNTLGLHFVGTKEMQPKSKPDFSQLLVRQEEELIQESLRLLYVALTRASQYLFVSGNLPKRVNESCYLQTALNIEGAIQRDESLVFEDMRDRKSFEYQKISELPQEDAIGRWQAIQAAPFQARKILNPHKFSSKGSTPSSSLPIELLAQIGSFIHYGLTRQWTLNPQPLDQAWTLLVENQAQLFIQANESALEAELKAQAYSEISENFKAPYWRELISPASQFWPELPLVQASSGTLMIGSCDLVTFMPNGDIHAFEFKTAPPPAEDNHYPNHCRRAGYFQQLACYHSALKAIYPQRRIRSFVGLTKLAQAIELS